MLGILPISSSQNQTRITLKGNNKPEVFFEDDEEEELNELETALTEPQITKSSKKTKNEKKYQKELTE